MDSVVELSVPARTSYVSLIRSATAAICAQADFTVDALDDLRLAVDEAAALVMSDAPPDSDISTRWQVTGPTVLIDISCPTTTGAPVAKNTFAWTVLTALVEDVACEVSDGQLHIRLQAHGIETTV
jgi:serine/threonine-protein kinase RsbW